jgi:cell division protein FtsL
VAVLAVVVAGAVLFGLAGVHVLLAEGQFRLQNLKHQADDAQARYVRLRLEVAQLESPQRIVAAAQQRLGMVPPSSLTYLTPTRTVATPIEGTAPPTTAPAGRPPDTTRGWATAKPALASRP